MVKSITDHLLPHPGALPAPHAPPPQRQAVRAEPSAPAAPAVAAAYTKSADAIIPKAGAERINEIATDFRAATGRTLNVNSGFRTPLSQADAMYEKFARGGDGREYRDQKALSEIKTAYDQGRRSRATRPETVNAMAGAIQAQMDSGVHISRHLVGGALDLQTKNLTAAQLTVLGAALKRQGITPLKEGIPPHWHIQF